MQKYLSCIEAFHSPMMYAKRNSYAKFQQNRRGFGAPCHAFSDIGLAGSKTLYLPYIKKLKLS